jgi:hypothetical protein
MSIGFAYLVTFQMKWPPIATFFESFMSVTHYTMGTLPFVTLGSTMIKTNLLSVVPRQLTQSVPLNNLHS